MKSRSLILLIYGVCLCLSCKQKDTPPTVTDTATVESPATVPESDGYAVTATYDFAAVYAGSIEYAFNIIVTTGTFDEEPQISMPENMLENAEEIMDLPGANPDMVGKRFKLHFNSNNQVEKIELAE